MCNGKAVLLAKSTAQAKISVFVGNERISRVG